MPKHAKVFLIERNKGIMKVTVSNLKLAGHEVVLTAANLKEAEEQLGLLREKEINVAVVDGYIGGEDNGLVAQEVVGYLRTVAPEVKIIIFSWVGVSTTLGDAYVDKSHHPGEIGEAVTKV